MLVVAAPLTSEDDVARRLDRTLDTMARRTCVCVLLAVRSDRLPVLQRTWFAESPRSSTRRRITSAQDSI